MSTKIGLFGFGCVAHGFYEGLRQNPRFDAEIVKICVKNPDKKRIAPNNLITTDPEEIFSNKDINVVIELIDDANAAFLIVKKSLENGVKVISANKKMIAENLNELVKLQRQYKTTLLYEGAVAGSIPILQNLDQFFGNQEIISIRGILNGCTNYILTRMRIKGISFKKALEEAQSLGFAETDPTLDVEAMDPVYKSVILAYHAYGCIIDPKNVKRTGITQIPLNLLLQARKENQKLKLIASIKNSENSLEIKVEPEIILQNDSLYSVDYEFNAIEIGGSLSGIQTFIGKGAGSYPTGSAVLNDLNLLNNGFNYKYADVSPLLKSA